MDMNGYLGGVPFSGYPVGAAPLLLNEFAPQSYDDLTETEKEHLILQCKDAETTEAKQRVMDSVSTDMDAKGLAEEEAADNRYF